VRKKYYGLVRLGLGFRVRLGLGLVLGSVQFNCVVLVVWTIMWHQQLNELLYIVALCQYTAFDYAVTGQLADMPTRGLPTRGLDDSRTGHFVDWSTRGLDNSRTGQVADWTTRGCHRRLCVLSFPVWRHLRERELSSPRLVQSAS